MTTNGTKRRLLFVCTGNICRSPMAKWIMHDLCRARGVADLFEIDSCGTGSWHAGEPADRRSAACGLAHGLSIDHIARQINAADLQDFDLLLVMDRSNYHDVLRLNPSREKVKMLRAFDPLLADADERECEVPDPYYGGEQGFELMHGMLHRACSGLLEAILANRV